MEQVIEELKKVIDEIYAMPENPSPKAPTRLEFTLLLGGVSACRKAPGVPGHMGYESLYLCEDGQAVMELREHLSRLYGITDKESLGQACFGQFTSGKEYEQFMTFWNQAPLFDLSELNENGKQGFADRISLASNFYPFLKERGFYAWDINERIGLARLSYACGLIDREEFEEMVELQVRRAQVFYHSYKEYAVSCLCGAVYFSGGYGEEEMLSFLSLNAGLLRSLLGEGGAWQRNAWYVPKEREWMALLPHNGGCIVSNQIAEGHEIGYMYREEAQTDRWPDTGWRFFTGEESEEYVNDPDHFTVWTLNDICNVDPTILGFVEAEYGRAYGKDENGEWVRER